MMPKAIFVRHSESTGNKQDIVKGTKDFPLNVQGKRESAAIATRIARYKPTEVISSPLKRALDPAKRIAQKAGVKLTIDHGLLPPDFGSITGEPRSTGEPKVKRYALKTPEKKFPGSKQSFSDWDKTNTGALANVRSHVQAGQRPVVVTHSRNLRELKHGLFGKPVADPTKGGPEPSGFVTWHGKDKLNKHKGVAA